MSAIAEAHAESRHYRTIARELDAAAEGTRSGDVLAAAASLDAAREALAALPKNAQRTLLEVRAKLEGARLKWLGAGGGTSSSLEEAFAAAAEAGAHLAGTREPVVEAEVAATMAGIAYDMGEPASLERAAKALDAAVTALLQAGRLRQAAELSTEQAALALRAGRDLEASELLVRSRTILEAMSAASGGTPTTKSELARIRHLMARLALHAAGPLDDDALVGAIEHAIAAESTYDELRQRRDLARVWETIARLEARRGRMEHARAGFVAAISVADTIADFVGLARSTEGLAQVLAALGDPMQALPLLASSIGLNRLKVCRLGLWFDEKALRDLERTLVSPSDAVLAELATTKAALTEARRAVGSLSDGVERWSA